MTLEQELYARIKTLEAENEKLKSQQHGTRRPFMTGEMREILDFGTTNYELLSRVVRSACFRKTVEMRAWLGGQKPSEITLKLYQMTDEEYEKFSRVMCEILRILKANEYKGDCE